MAHYMQNLKESGTHLGQRLIANFHWEQFAHQWMPVTKWLFNYRVEDLPYDVIAGFTVGLTLVPQCLSYAALANVRSEFGLYTSFLGQLIYFIFGTSKDGSVGPTAITSMMMGQINGMYNPMADEGDNTYNALICFISGLIMIGVGVLNLGFIVSLFSIPLVSGFTSAAGFIIIASQMKLFFGLKAAPNESPSVFVKQMKNIYDRRSEIKPYDVLCACLCMAVLFTFQYLPLIIAKVKALIYRKKPMPMQSRFEAKAMEVVSLIVASRNVIVFVIATGVAYGLWRDDPDFEKKLTLVGFIKPGLPSWQFPATEVIKVIHPNASVAANLTMTAEQAASTATKVVVLKSVSEIIKDLSAMIIIIPLMTMLELFAITKALGRKNGYSVDPSCELIAVGLGNFLQSFINAFPATTTISRCALNDQCKVKTQLASVISALIVIVTLAALTPLFYFIPKPTLAAIMCCAGYNLVDLNIAIHMWHDSPRDVFILVGTFCMCLFYDIAYGILISLLLSMVSFLRPIIAMSLDITREKMSTNLRGFHQPHYVTVVRLPHGMEYPSCDRFIDEITNLFCTTEDKNLIFDCRFITDVDYSGLQAFRALLILAFKKEKHVIITNLRDELQAKFESVGMEHFKYVRSVDEAVEEHYWASTLNIPEAGGASVPHVGSIVVSEDSPRRFSMPAEVQLSTAGLDADKVDELRKPVSTAQLGNAWRQKNGLFSASFASMWTVAQLGHVDDDVLNDWNKTARMRSAAARRSSALINHQFSQQKSSDNSETSAINIRELNEDSSSRRRKVMFATSPSGVTQNPSGGDDDLSISMEARRGSRRLSDQSEIIQELQEEEDAEARKLQPDSKVKEKEKEQPKQPQQQPVNSLKDNVSLVSDSSL